MKLNLLTLSIILTFSVSYASNWKIIETITYDWDNNKKEDVFILETKEDWSDPGDYLRVRIHLSGKPEYIIDAEGEKIEYYSEYYFYDQPRLTKKTNLLNSEYLLLIAPFEKYPQNKILILNDYDYPARPGSIRFLALGSDGIPYVFLNINDAKLYQFEDINNDHIEDIVTVNYPEFQRKNKEYMFSPYYPPYSVYLVNYKNDIVIIEGDNSINMEYNKKYYGPWIGSQYIDYIYMVRKLDGSEPRLLFNWNINEEGLFLDNSDSINKADYRDYPYLIYEIKRNNYSAIKFLLDAGANIDIIDKDGKTPLFYAVLTNNSKITKLLLNKGANPNTEIINDLSLLDIAKKNSNSEIVELLIKHGVKK